MRCLHRYKMVQLLLWLDKLCSRAGTSVGGLPIAIALPVLEVISYVFTMEFAYVKFKKFRGIYALSITELRTINAAYN